MGPGIDPHLYKASPGDLRLLSNAQTVIFNGLHLEGKLSDALEKLKLRKPVFAVSERIPPERLRKPTPLANLYDPHIWFDVSLWILAAERIRDILIEQDRLHESSYRERFDRYRSSLEELHAWCKDLAASVPAERRVLITAHDAFGYFGQAYGFEVRGIQGLSTDSEASLQDISFLVNLIVSRRIPAVFVESSVSPKMVQALVEGASSRGHKLTIGGELYSDSLGGIGSDATTYQEMVRRNLITISEALKR
jgi:manganese/zinc/iron transport system substrate-binding protein